MRLVRRCYYLDAGGVDLPLHGGVGGGRALVATEEDGQLLEGGHDLHVEDADHPRHVQTARAVGGPDIADLDPVPVDERVVRVETVVGGLEVAQEAVDVSSVSLGSVAEPRSDDGTLKL